MITMLRLWRAVLLLTWVIAVTHSASAQDTVTVGLPGSVSFAVGTGLSVTGSPDPTTVTFSNASLTPGQVLRISVMPASAAFTGPGGSSYPATAVSWSVSNVSGGSGAAGTLSTGGYTQVFQSSALESSGSFELTWTITPAGGAQYAGVHAMTLRWKLESVQP